STAGETMVGYEVDRLFRSDIRPAAIDWAYNRAEASRILLTSTRRGGVAPEDRAYLRDMVANETRISTAEASARVDDVINRAKQSINAVRHSAIIMAFATAAALLLGAV